MRSTEFPSVKEDPDELRGLVIGDSIVYGGGLLDQKEIATERLQPDLAESIRPVIGVAPEPGDLENEVNVTAP